MPNQVATLNRVFHALADPTRRSVLERLCRGPAAVGELAEPFDMALPSFMQHLRVLEDCAVVTSHKQGRVRIYRLTRKPLSTAETWLGRQRDLWEKRLNQLDDYLKEMKEKE